MNRERRAASLAEATACPISERAPSLRRFFPGRPLDPPRAGMTPKANGVTAIRLHPHPATLRGRLHGGVDHAHGLEAVPAVTGGRRLPADAGEKVLRLVDVHVVELAPEGIDLPAIGPGVEETDL